MSFSGKREGEGDLLPIAGYPIGGREASHKKNDEFTQEALEREAGIRAIWLLYQAERWDDLADFGVEREIAEPLFRQFDRENVTNNKAGQHPLSIKQCRELVRLVPGLEEAGKELRLAYALKFYEQAKHYSKAIEEEGVRTDEDVSRGDRNRREGSRPRYRQRRNGQGFGRKGHSRGQSRRGRGHSDDRIAG